MYSCGKSFQAKKIHTGYWLYQSLLLQKKRRFAGGKMTRLLCNKSARYSGKEKALIISSSFKKSENIIKSLIELNYSIEFVSCNQALLKAASKNFDVVVVDYHYNQLGLNIIAKLFQVIEKNKILLLLSTNEEMPQFKLYGFDGIVHQATKCIY